ncbi:hypothetical protein INT45_012177 [Circinella minor]|uniref:Myb-like domain-containing protein n=1 Tax=Circinella minor TaxID=1195481 RepID=A0A8H7SBQ0_9FUNG|nr:hypothetical protein INT45_012177 [Circinella minor]
MTHSSSSVRSNSKKRAIYTSDTNNVDNNNKEDVEKKRRRKSQGQQEDDHEENKVPKTGRPRWTREERYLLLKAILGEKKLEHMRTFHWECISQQVGKKKKTCKDQWRLELVPSFLDIFSETIGTNEPSYSEEEENISDDSEDDTDECLNEMYCDIPNGNEHDNDNNKSFK